MSTDLPIKLQNQISNIYLAIYLPVYLPIYPFFYQVGQSISLPVYVSTLLSIYAYLFNPQTYCIYQSIHLPILESMHKNSIHWSCNVWQRLGTWKNHSQNGSIYTFGVPLAEGFPNPMSWMNMLNGLSNKTSGFCCCGSWAPTRGGNTDGHGRVGI